MNMRRLFSTITLVMLAMLVMAQAPVVSRKKSQDQPTTTPSKPAQQKPATQPTTPRRPTTGVLTITSTPSDASVKLDNDYLGTTPITIRQQRPGTYTITFSAEGYETMTKSVTVTAGETTTCTATLVKKEQAAPTTPTTPTTISTPSTTVTGFCPITDILNPMDGGIYLGWTTVDEAIAVGGKNTPRDDGKHVVSFAGRDYWDHDKDNILEFGYFTKYEGIPDSWKRAGLSIDMSYSQWLDWLKRNGFEIAITKTPQISTDSKYSGSLDAEVEATLNQAKLRVDLDFNYSMKSSVNDSGTLYSIIVRRSNIRGTMASMPEQQPVQQPSTSSELPTNITIEYLINHPLCYFNSWNVGVDFQQAYSQISREHPEWVLDNYQQANEHLWIDDGLAVYYMGARIKRCVAYWYESKKLVSHAFYLKDMTADQSDEILKATLRELSKLGYSMSRSTGTYTTTYKGTVRGMEVEVEQWNKHGKDLEISVNYRSLKK